MNRRLRYLIIFCCTILLILFLGQIEGYTTAQDSSQKSNQVNAIAFNPKGNILASGTDDGQIALVNVSTGKLLQTLKNDSGAAIAALVYTADGKLTSVSRDTVVQQWDLVTGKKLPILQGLENPPRAIAVSPDGKLLASAGEDPKVAIWDLTTNKLVKVLEGHERFVNSIAFNSSGTLLASADDNGWINLWDIKEGKLQRTLLGHADGITAIAFSPDPNDANKLASVSKDTTVRLWDVSKGQQLKVLRKATKALRTVAFNRDGTVLLTGGDDKNIYLWGVKSGELRSTLRSIQNTAIKAIAVSPDGLNFASGYQNGDVSIWDTATGLVKQTIQLTTSLLNTVTSLLSLNLGGSNTSQPVTSVITGTVGTIKQTLMGSAASSSGAPILIVTSTSNPFSNYYSEILLNEGLNNFNTSDITSISQQTLAQYDIVLLGEIALSTDQVAMFTDWVADGGNLIAMRPDKKLATLLGLLDTSSSLDNGYLLVDTSTETGYGIVDQTIQYHGSADRYTLNGASSIANLYTNATTATSNPAITVRNIGNNGGSAAAFTYDLARSVIYTRQGNIAWANQERDSLSPIRSDDLFYGNANNDIQPDWVNLNKVAIPQADEQQRLLANLIIKINLDKKPLPRFWYFPNGKKAVVLMTGDDHANGGTAGRFDQFKAKSPANCSLDNWDCVRGTSYIYPNSPLSSQQAAAYEAEGFEVALHVNTNCADFTASTLEDFYTQQLSSFTTNYSSIPAPSTQRHHCLVWSDWFSTPIVELNHGIRFDTTYYYWPPSWVANRPGFFTGSGMPMRLANTDGTTIDVYNATTQLTDESGQTYPSSIDTLLDRAIGSQGYYGVFNVNAHTDATNSLVADAVVTSAQARGVPIVSAKQMLTWLDGRNSSSFSSLSWSNNTLNFTITKATGANNLQAMLPTRRQNLVLNSITRNGNAISYTAQAIKGIEYALFPGDTGSYIATYIQDTTPPTVTTTTPSSNATGVSTVTTITATFSEAINPTSINSSSLELRNQGNTLITANVTYDEATRTATLTPTSPLAISTTYNLTIIGGAINPRVVDLAGNALANNFTFSFTTASTPPPLSIWNNSQTPTNPSISDPNAVELGVKFRSDIDGFITGVRFYKGSGNTGTHIGNLWSSDGTQLATATFSNETASGWQQVNFSSPVAISANTVYVASYHTSVGNYAADSGFFAGAGVDNPPLHLLRDGESGGNGVYNYGASSFPNNTFQASNYWVDVVFVTSTGPDTTPPTVTSASPNSGATAVSTSTTVTVTFNEAMDSATINSNTFELRDSNNASVAATISYNTANRTATLTPTSPLANSTAYTVTVKGGGSDPRVKDLAGNALAANFTRSFTTVAIPTCPCNIWNGATTPSVVTVPDPNAVELGVKFQSDVNGYITGVRFYKGASNTGTHVGTVWSSTGTQLARATFSNETASGWQQVNLTTPVAISANTTYVVSYHTNVGYYSLDQGYFANAGVDNSPLHALSNASGNGNGVYNYSANPAFPSSTFNSSNYWVDIVFSTN
ncbi:Ig domain protein group 1 domain protein [Nostoc sp. NIES-4103]|nr:Ig domain protein group 1 domain protein [Nostoc sp. NIES-4103]